MSNDSAELFGISIHALSWAQAESIIMQWTQEPRSRVVCACNVHSVVSAKADPELKKALKSADMRTPDGAPLAWLMRKIGWPDQQRRGSAGPAGQRTIEQPRCAAEFRRPLWGLCHRLYGR